MGQSFPSLGNSSKAIAISILFLILLYAIMFTHDYYSQLTTDIFTPSQAKCSPPLNSPTNISHLKFVLISSINSWKYRKPYIEAWWRPNETRGNIFFDSPPTEEWPSSSPPFKVNEDLAVLKVYPQLINPLQTRMYRSIFETFRLGDDEDVRWYVMGDDDSLFLVDNLVEELSKYDHTKFYYIGMNSEAIKSNADFSFNMAYGGGGYALSYSLVEELAPLIDECIERYPRIPVSDQLSSTCLADLGVDLTLEKGFHQIDLHGDISSFLSSHPQASLISLHHFDIADPIFPFKSRSESVKHLTKAAKFDQSRMLQQTICYHRPTNWSFSVSWGYSAHIYENIIPRSVLKKPLQTFIPFDASAKPPLFMFDTRIPSNDPCESPHFFFLESIEEINNEDDGQLVLTVYKRNLERNLPPCSSNGNHSADPISEVHVFSTSTRPKTGKAECCDVEYVDGAIVVDIKLRACLNGEVMA